MEYKTIKELCDLVVDCPHSTPTWTEHGKIVIRNNNIKNGKIDFTSPSFTDGEHFAQRIKRAVPKAGDIVITREAPMGEVGMIPEDIECCLGQRMVLLRANERICDTYYLLYGLQSQFVRHQISWSEGTGTTVSNLRIPHLEQIRVPYIPLNQQKKISSVLHALEDKIENNRKVNENLEQQAQTLFKSWFVDFEPFDESFIDSPIGTKIPHSLQMVQIGSLPHILETGKRPKGGAVATGAPSIGAENVKRLGEVNFASAKYIPVEFAQKMDKGKVHGYELMLYKDGGKPGTFIPHFSMFGEGFPYDDFFINEHDFKLDFGDKGFNEFCYFYLQTDYPYNWLANNGGKAAVPGINQQDVNSIWIYHPDNSLVKEYCKWVQPIFTTILKNCLQNVKLSQLRDALLPKLMSGELDVSNIEI